MKKELHFNRDEYSRRLNLVKMSMDREGIELLIVCDPANMAYLTGYDGWSFYVPQGVIVHKDCAEPLWYGRGQDSNGARLTAYMDDESVIGYADELVQSRTSHVMVFVAEMLKKRGWDKLRIGLEMDAHYFSAAMYIWLQKELPQAEFIDAGTLVNWIKTVKSAPEIAYIREAAQMTENAMEKAVEMITPGVPEREVGAAVIAAEIRGTDSYGGGAPAIFPLIPSAERTTTSHLSFHPERSYQKGDIVFMELGACRHRYHAPLSRTVFLGEPTAAVEKVSKIVIDGTAATLEAIKPGITAEGVELVWRNFLKGSGIEKTSRIGYSFGLSYPPDWGERTVSLRPGDKSVLQPGMTIHLMTGIWQNDFGFECSEPFLVTENGCEKFCRFPAKLFVK